MDLGNIESVSEEINWTSAWSKKYPILDSYQSKVDIRKYSTEISRLCNELIAEYDFNELDAFLILKDILYHEYLDRKNGTT